MDSVYNRKLFQRKEDRAARDQLRRMGGIMGSSEELMQAAQQGFQTAQPPKMTGQGQVMSMAPSIVPTAQDMMRQPQMGMPQQPQMQPQMQASVQPPTPMNQRRGFQDGGMLTPSQMEEYRNSRLLTGARSMDAPTMSRPTITEPVTITETPDEVTPTVAAPDASAPSSPAEALEKAESLIEDPEIPAEQKAEAILETTGAPRTGDLVQDIRALYEQSVGGEIPRDATIDELNRGIFGATMASSRNPRAAGAFAEGLSAALEAMRETEIGRQEREMGLKGTEFEVRAGREQAAIRAAMSGSKNQDEAFEEITKIFQSLTTTGNRSGEEAVAFLNDTIPGLGDRYMEYIAGKAGVNVERFDAPAGAPSNVVPPSETTQYLNAANSAIERINSSTSSMEMKQAEYKKVQDTAARLGIDVADLLPLGGE